MLDIQRKGKENGPKIDRRGKPVFHKPPLGISSWWQYYISTGGNGSRMRMHKVTMAATKRRNGLRKNSTDDMAHSLSDT